MLVGSAATTALLTDWTELLVLAVAGGLVLAAGILLVLVPNPVRVRLSAHPERVTVGDTVIVRVGMVPRLLPVLFPVLEVQVGTVRRSVRLPLLLPAPRRTGSRRAERGDRDIELPALRRGVHHVGPVVRLRSDPCGCFSRRQSWPVTTELYVRPRVALLPQQESGQIRDLEGVVSDRPAPSDLAFHTLREYTRGDDLRHVHWRSSAKADQLLVRQFVETRHSETVVVVDADLAAYADEDEFELAVSTGASVAVRAALDHCEVTIACGDEELRSGSTDVLLDEMCRWTMGTRELVDVVVGTARGGLRANLAVVITGSARAKDALLISGTQLPPQALRILVRVDRAGTGRVGDAHGLRLMTVTGLRDLPELFAGVHG